MDQQVVTIAVAAIAATPGWLAFWSARRKGRADMLTAVTDAYAKLIEPYRKKVDGLCKDVERLKARNQALETINEEISTRLEKLMRENERILKDNDELWRGVATMLGQLDELKVEPAWVPPDRILRRFTDVD